MSVSNEKAFEHAREVEMTIRDMMIDDAIKVAAELEERHRGHVANEDLAFLVFEAYCDYLEDRDVHPHVTRFASEFPGLSVFI
jgi:hypothetical protein